MNDFFTLEFFHTAGFIAQIFGHGSSLIPVAGDQREDVGKDLAVGGVGTAIAQRRHGNLIFGNPVQDTVGDAGRERLYQ